MPCEEENNCVPCSSTPCPDETCPEKNYSDENCDATYAFKCSTWTGDPVECLGIVTGDTGDIVISKLMDAVCNSVVNSPDKQVRISSADTTNGYLEDKLLAGSGITLTKGNTGGNETLTISLTTAINTPLVVSSSNNTILYTLSGTANHTANLRVAVSADSGNLITVASDGLYAIGTDKVKVSGTDTTADYLLSKLVAGTNVTITKLNSGGNETIRISAAGGSAGLTGVTTTDTDTAQFSGTGTSSSPLSMDVKISSTLGNTLTSDSDGLYVPETTVPAAQTLSWNSGTRALTLSGGGGTVTISDDNTETAITVNDSSTINFTASGTSNHTITADVKVSADAGNTITIHADGIYASSTISGTAGAVLYGTGSSYAATAVGSAGQVLQSNGSGAPSWVTLSGSGTVTSVSVATANGFAGSVASSTTTPSISITTTVTGMLKGNGTAISAAVAGTDYQAPITLTTTGTSGAATFAANVLNIPQFQGVITANNGLTFSANNVKLGGSLTAATTITSASYKYLHDNTSDVLIGGSFGSGGTINLSGSSTGGTEAETGYAGIYGAVSLSKSVSCTLDNSSIYAGVWGASYFNQTGTITNGIFSAIESWSLFANTGSLTAAAGLYLRAPRQQTGQTAFSGTCTTFSALQIEAISTSTIAAQFTNKFAIYQAGTGDTSRFYGTVQTTSGSVTTISDSRVKENVVDFNRGLTEIEQIATHRFNYTFDKGRVATGILAQELEQIIPEAVRQEYYEGQDGTVYTDFRSVDTNTLVFALINAVKELSAKVKTLEAK